MDAEYPQVYLCKLRKARKTHKCYECHGVIKVGELYHYHHGVWDHKGCSFKICDDCQNLKIEIVNSTPLEAQSLDEDLSFGELRNYIAESYNHLFIGKFLDIQTKRGALIDNWLEERQQNLLDKIDRLELEGIQYDEQDVPF